MCLSLRPSVGESVASWPTPLKKINFLFPVSHQLPRGPQIGVGLTELLPTHAGTLAGLILQVFPAALATVSQHVHCHAQQT